RGGREEGRLAIVSEGLRPSDSPTRSRARRRYAAQSTLPEGGDRIVIATDRQMSMWEVRDRPRIYDYPFMLIEIRIPKEGKGEGRMFGATQIRFDRKENQIVLEQYSAGEVRLN